mgnify:CR=1 FL=1
MQQNISLIYDLLFLIVFAVVAVCSWHKGFLASLAELIGAVFGVGIAVWASQTAAPQIYEKFLSASVANRVELALRESNGNIAEALQGISFLPESMQQSLLNLLNDAGSDVPAKIAEALQPLILPFVQVLLFVVLYAIGMMNYRGFLKPQVFCNLFIDNAALIVATVGITFVLLIGGLGLANGAVDCWLLALALWFLVGVTGGKLSWLNGYILSQSVGYGIFGSVNPFV